MIKIRVFIGLMMLAACSVTNAGAAKRNAELFDKAAAHQAGMVREISAAEATKAQAQADADVAAYKACEQSKDVGMCIQSVKMISVMESLVAGHNRQMPSLQVPYERDMAAKFRDFMAPMAPLMGQAMSTYQGVEALQSNERIALSRDATFAGLANSALTANAAVAGAAVENAQPVYNVGGDWTGGDRVTTTIGDNFTGGDRSETNISAGHDIVGGDQRIGDDVGRDQIGGDRVDNSGIIGDYNEYRFESPGPIDNSDPGDDCTEADCSQPPPAKALVEYESPLSGDGIGDFETKMQAAKVGAFYRAMTPEEQRLFRKEIGAER